MILSANAWIARRTRSDLSGPSPSVSLSSMLFAGVANQLSLAKAFRLLLLGRGGSGELASHPRYPCSISGGPGGTVG